MSKASNLIMPIIRSSGVGRDGAGASPFLSLPYVKGFEGDTLSTLPAEWTQKSVSGLWTGTQGTAEVQSRIDGFGNDVPHTKAMFCQAHPTTNIGTSISMDLGKPIDASDGYRMSWYARHYNEASSGDDAAYFHAPLLSENGGEGEAWSNFYQKASSENVTYFEYYDGDAYALHGTSTAWNLLGTHSWHCFRGEINFAGGSASLGAWRDTGTWTNVYNCSDTFTALTGPTNLQYLCLGSAGSASSWKVYDSVQIAQVWIGALTDDWPTVGSIWSV
jgi:hypothetical protein